MLFRASVMKLRIVRNPPLAIALLALAGCYVPDARSGAPAAGFAAPIGTATIYQAPERAPAHLDVEIDKPAPSHFDATRLGPADRTVRIHVKNDGDRVIALTPVEVTFSAARNGVVFPCGTSTWQPKTRQPERLAPNATFTFEREIDCAMPLPGSYDLEAHVSFGKGLSVDRPISFVVLDSPLAPVAYPGRDGIYVTLLGGPYTPPLSEHEWERGVYHVVVAVINAGSTRAPLGEGRLFFLTYRAGSRLPCSGQSEALPFPAYIEPGSIAKVPSPVACAPSEEGIYEIVGGFALGAKEPAMQIGRIHLTVSSEPPLFAPAPEIVPSTPIH